ncbi:diacylglycerol kinase [Herbaspirillum sp. GCM10030257]|uniref:diacylglycerol kinase n=1 Tax=Herbaspirillum sp. GCM10030257 TaxID=3273393 RepID=UPI003609B014
MNDSHLQISEFKSKNGLKRILRATGYSIAGLRTAWKSEHAFRQELMLVIPACIIAFLVPVPVLQRVALVAVLFLVLIVELINSAIEAVVDRVSFERHPLSKNAKDFGSAAVFLALTLAAITWGIILFPVILGRPDL